MRPKWVGVAAVAAAFAVAAPGALAAHAPARSTSFARGDLVVIFSGTGGGSYRFHQPPQGAGSACRVADTTYGETDTYRWSYRFVVPPSGGSSDTPVALSASGELASSEQLLQCAADAAATTSCTQLLRAPGPDNSSDLAYPGVTVSLAGRFLDIGAVGELVAASPQPSCTGVGVLLANPLPAYSQLQAGVDISRAALAASGDVTRRFTITGSGLYTGLPLGANCDSTTCETTNCSDTATPNPDGPSSCSYEESFSGTIEVRVVR
jgi:hypothetical protein